MGYSGEDNKALAEAVEKRLDEETRAREEQDSQVMKVKKKPSGWDLAPEVPMVAKLVAIIAVIALGVFLPMASYCQNNPKSFANLSGTPCPDEEACLSCKVVLNTYFKKVAGHPSSCEDGTSNYACSKNLPLECMFGQLVPNATKCGCPAGFAPSGGWCRKLD